MANIAINLGMTSANLISQPSLEIRGFRQNRPQSTSETGLGSVLCWTALSQKMQFVKVVVTDEATRLFLSKFPEICGSTTDKPKGNVRKTRS